LAVASKAVNLAILGVYTALSLLMFANVWQNPGTELPGVAGDPNQMAWFLSWTPYALSHGHDPFFTTHLNYPFGVNLAWNTTMPILGLLSWPVQKAFGEIVTFNVLMTLAFATSAWTAYLAINRYVPWRVAAFAGGLFYGFSPYMTAQAWAHLNLVFMALPPLIFLVLDDAVVRQDRTPLRTGLLLGLLGGVQFLIMQEVLALTALVAALALLILAALNPSQVRRRLPHLVQVSLFALPLFFLLTAWPVYTLFFGDQRIEGHLDGPDDYVTDVANLLVPTEAILLAPAAAVDLSNKFTGNISEWNGYIGLPMALLFVAIVVLRWRDPLVRFLGLITPAIVILSGGSHAHIAGVSTPIPGPWLLIGQIPLIDNILPVRLMAYADFFLALLLAYAMWQVAKGPVGAAFRPPAEWGGRGIRSALAVTLAVVCLLPIVPRWPFPTNTPVVPPFFHDGVETLPEGSNLLVTPFPGPTCTVGPCPALDAMLWQAVAGFRYRMPGGYYTGPGPDGKDYWLGTETETSIALRAIEAGHPAASIQPSTRDALLNEWRDWGIDAAVLGPMAHQDEMLTLLTEMLGRPPEYVQGVYLWRSVEPLPLPSP
jgi:hypothetical protein